jgi:hypothetical protein
MQAESVVDHMLSILGSNIKDEVSWEDFQSKIKYLIPKTMPDKMDLFLKSIAPQTLSQK